MAGRLAEFWAPQFGLDAAGQQEWLASVYHHDDGWAEWDAAPGIEPTHGYPLSFTEMDVRDSTQIWRRSIGNAARLGHLAAYVVAGHFAALIEPSPNSKRRDKESAIAASSFQRDMTLLRSNEFKAWQVACPINRLREQAELAVRWLRFFDARSLWLCCNANPEPERVEAPDGVEYSFCFDGGKGYSVEPWPYRPSTFDINTAAAHLPAARYKTSDELISASEAFRLQFVFRNRNYL